MRIIDNFEDVELFQPMEEAAIESLYEEIQAYSFDDYGVEGIREAGKATWDWIKKIIKQAWQFIQNRYFSMKSRSKKFTEWVKTKIAKLRGVLVGDIIDLESKCKEIEDALHKVEVCYEPLQKWLNEIKSFNFTETDWAKEFESKFKENSSGEMSKGADSWSEDMLITFINMNMKKHTEYVQKYSSILNGMNELASKNEKDFESGRIDKNGFKIITKMLQLFTKCYNKIAQLDQSWMSKVKALLEEAQKASKASSAKQAEAAESVGVEGYLGGASQEEIKAGLTKEAIASIKSAAEEVASSIDGAKAVGKRKGNAIVAITFSNDTSDSTVYKAMKKLQAKVKGIDHPANTKWECIQDDGFTPAILCVLDRARKKRSGNENVESKLVEAIMEEYGIEGVTSIIRNLSSK